MELFCVDHYRDQIGVYLVTMKAGRIKTIQGLGTLHENSYE